MTHCTTNRRRFLRAAGSALLVGLAGCGTGSGGSTPRQTETEALNPDARSPAPDDSPVEPEGESGATVDIAMITDNKGSYFDPKGLLVESGATVRFVNESGSHTATAYHPDTGDVPLRIPDRAVPWDSGLFTEAGKTFEVTFEIEGVYDYYCVPHEMLGMVGRIVVGESRGGPGTTPPDGLPPAAREALPAVDSILDRQVVAGP